MWSASYFNNTGSWTFVELVGDANPLADALQFTDVTGVGARESPTVPGVVEIVQVDGQAASQLAYGTYDIALQRATFDTPKGVRTVAVVAGGVHMARLCVYLNVRVASDRVQWLEVRDTISSRRARQRHRLGHPHPLCAGRRVFLWPSHACVRLQHALRLDAAPMCAYTVGVTG